MIKTKSHELAEKTGAEQALYFRTRRVLFLLTPEERHLEFFRGRSKEVADRWGSQIRLASHSPSGSETS